MIDNDNIHSPYQVAEIKQAFIEIYKDEYEPDCEDNIFNDLNEIDSVSDYSCDEKTQRMEDTSSQGSAEWETPIPTIKTLRILTEGFYEQGTDSKTSSELQHDRHIDDERWLNSVIKLVNNTNLNNRYLTSNNCLTNSKSKSNYKIVYANKIDKKNDEKNLIKWTAKTAHTNELVFVPDIIPEADNNHLISKEIYSNNDGSVQQYAQIPEHNMHIFTVDFKNEYQTDMGANISATNNKSILHNFKLIPPRPVSGISSNDTHTEANVHITGIGSLYLISMDGVKLHIDVHYGENINGTILSPTAITKQHIKRFNGYILEADMDKSTGFLRLISRHRNYTMDFKLSSHNELWFHT